jgi:molybdenum cofactor guanylyltransferase
MFELHLGVPLVHHAIRRLDEVCDEVVVVLAPDGREPEPPPGVAIRVARDATTGRGPLAGLAAGLAATATDWAVVVGGDMPDVSGAVVLEMLRVGDAESVSAVVLAEGGVARPLPLAVRTDAGLRAAGSLLGDGARSLLSLVDALRPAVLDERAWRALDPSRGTLRDVDVPADLDR